MYKHDRDPLSEDFSRPDKTPMLMFGHAYDGLMLTGRNSRWSREIINKMKQLYGYQIAIFSYMMSKWGGKALIMVRIISEGR